MAALGFTLLVLAAAVDVEGGATADLRRGEVPVELDQPSHPATVGAITPLVGVLLSDREGDLRLHYDPRISWVDITEAGHSSSEGSPYVLHNADLTGQWRAAHRLTFNIHGHGSTGDTDYTALTQVLGRRQAQIPTITGITSYLAGAGLTAALARDWRLETTLDFVHNSMRGSTPAVAPGETAPVVFLPSDSTVSLVPDLFYSVDQRNTIDLRAGLNYVWVTTNLKILSLTPELSWRTFFERNASVKLGAGLAYSDTVAYPLASTPGLIPVPPGTARSSVSPIGDIALNAQFYGSRGVVVTGGASAAATWYFDPILVLPGTLGNAAFQLTITFPPDWSVGAEGFFTTSLRSHPIQVAPGQIPFDETAVGGAIPIRYRISRTANLEVGGRWTDRAPHLRYHPFVWRHHELWIYAAITGTFGTHFGAITRIPRAGTTTPVPEVRLQ